MREEHYPAPAYGQCWTALVLFHSIPAGSGWVVWTAACKQGLGAPSTALASSQLSRAARHALPWGAGGWLGTWHRVADPACVPAAAPHTSAPQHWRADTHPGQQPAAGCLSLPSAFIPGSQQSSRGPGILLGDTHLLSQATCAESYSPNPAPYSLAAPILQELSTLPCRWTPSWDAHHGVPLMECPLQSAHHGVFVIKCSSWGIHNGVLIAGCPTWGAHCGVLTMGCPLQGAAWHGPTGSTAGARRRSAGRAAVRR